MKPHISYQAGAWWCWVRGDDHGMPGKTPNMAYANWLFDRLGQKLSAYRVVSFGEFADGTCL